MPPSDPDAPSGTVSFLFTDLVGSTRMWSAQASAMADDLARHDGIIRAAVSAHHGYVFSTGGDGFGVAFSRASDAVAAALDIQQTLGEQRWAVDEGLVVRMGIHTGTAIERGGDYFGPTVNAAARIMAVAHGGQVVVSNETHVAGVRGDLRPLGEHRLRDLPAPMELYQVVSDGLVADFPPLTSVGASTSTLPEHRSSFVGRQEELARVLAMLADDRLVTLCGAGGAGKTRLAIEAASVEASRHPDGVYFVDLGAVDEPSEVVWAVTAGIRLRVAEVDAQQVRLEEFLRDRDVLLVMDNCEHLVDDVADLVDDLLSRSPGLRVLATSREPLGLEGERIYRVPSLDPSTAGLHLFVERATAISDDFELTDGNRSHVVDLCERLDGIPLAIELAASRTVTFSPGELLDRIDDRLQLLRGSRRRGRASRQRTLEGTIDWSHTLLDEDERVFFRRLGGFSGVFVVDVVPGVTGFDTLRAGELLEALVAKSLVVRSAIDDEQSGFHLLESVRVYAAAKLAESGETDDVLERHLHSYHRYCAFGVQTIRGDWSWTRAYRAQITDIWVAVDHALDRERPDVATDLLDAGSIGAIGDGPRAAATLERLERLAGEHLDELGPERQGRLLGDLAMARMSAGRVLDSVVGSAAALRELQGLPSEYTIGLVTNQMIQLSVTEPAQGLRLADEAIVACSDTDEGRQAAPQLSYMRGSCLAGLRRYAEAVESAMAVVTDVDTFIRDTALASLLWSAHLGGVPAPARALEIATDVDPADGGWRSTVHIVAALHRLSIEDAPREVAAFASRWLSGRLRFEEAEYLAAFARLAHLRGDDARAVELLDATIPRSPWTIAAISETLGVIEGWAPEEWAVRRTADVLARNEPGRVAELTATGPVVLADELARHG